jgi:hypothetical protein
MCRANLKGFASHIHVLYREVPHILCITQLPANCARLEDVGLRLVAFFRAKKCQAFLQAWLTEEVRVSYNVSGHGTWVWRST